MGVRTLSDWLEIIQRQHRKTMDLSLERITMVADRLCAREMPCPLVTVGGTNGKGSTVAGLEAIWRAAGYRVGAFTSPWLYRFNELIRVQGEAVSDAALVAAFEKIEEARGTVTLTVFEFNTLAALLIFRQMALDVVILEVGLGGRLDAVNILSPDVAVVTSIALDHMEWLGNTREAIAFEKAGIFRKGKPGVCGDPVPPASLKVKGVPLFVQNEAFGFLKEAETWSFWSGELSMGGLPLPELLLQNMATVLQVITLLQSWLPVSRSAIETGLRHLRLPGRLQRIEGDIPEIRDVSHNPAAVLPLVEYLRETRVSGRTLAVFSMLADKDIASVLRIMREEVQGWWVAPLQTDRGASLSRLKTDFEGEKIGNARFFETIPVAYAEATQVAERGDRIVVFGSFYTLAALHA